MVTDLFVLVCRFGRVDVEKRFQHFPAISSSLSTLAFWMKDPRHTKAISIAASLCTLTYNIMQAHSLIVYVGVSFTILSATISLLDPLFKRTNNAEKRTDINKNICSAHKNGSF